jgi:8-oxo-dGTP diphosphatase
MTDVAVGIVVHEGRILACQRKRSSRYPLKWEFPGGKVEPGETPVQTVRREIREELGIDLTTYRMFHQQEWVYPEGVSNIDHEGAFRIFYYLVTGYTGTLANKVFEQIRWVQPQELVRMDILEGNREAASLLAKNGASPETASLPD